MNMLLDILPKIPVPSLLQDTHPLEQEPCPLGLIGEVLISARKERGWTQLQLAERVGTQQAAVARWERGKYKTATLQTILMIMGALEIDIQLLTIFD
jgi:DNA-binding XRE family transcriptional regulator